MKRVLFAIIFLAVTVALFGCRKDQQAVEGIQDQPSMEAISAIPAGSEVRAPEAKAQVPLPAMEQPQALEPLPPSGPYRPKATEIQAALKNANLYTGAVDGKIGPMTKAAIEKFQQENGLEVDGKVGPKTWAALSRYLAAPAEPERR